MSISISIYLYTYIPIYLYIYISIYLYIYISIYLFLYISIYLYIYVYIYIYIYIYIFCQFAPSLRSSRLVFWLRILPDDPAYARCDACNNEQSQCAAHRLLQIQGKTTCMSVIIRCIPEQMKHLYCQSVLRIFSNQAVLSRTGLDRLQSPCPHEAANKL